MLTFGRKATIVHCALCNNDVKYFTRHIKKYHPEITEVEYFDKYVRTDPKQGFCRTCGKPTRFKGVVLGYTSYCDASCELKDRTVQQKMRDSYFKKTGYHHNWQNPEVIAKVKQTQTEKYGGIGFASKEIRERAFKGLDNCMHNPEVAKKVVATKYAKTNGKYLSEKQLKAIQAANKQPERCKKAKQTRYARYNGKYMPDKEITDIKNQAIERYRDKVKIIKFKYNSSGMCRCQCLDCKKEFDILYSSLRTRLLANKTPCYHCEPLGYTSTLSNEEKDLLQFIKSVYLGQVIENDRTVLEGKELDIYLPDKKLAFEFDGLYWHDELHKEYNYHLKKTIECEKNGIQLIHVFEDEWILQKDIVCSRIKHLLYCSNEKIYARKCQVKQVDAKISCTFLKQNHIQGNCSSKYRYGLYYNDELVSLMTFGKSRFKKDEFELLRFCNKSNVNVIGGASRLFKHFLKDHPEIHSIVSYADRRWSVGNLYEKLGFTKVCETKPNYSYVIDGHRENRIKYQKHKLIAEGFDPNKSEHEIMLDRKIYRIYDCGNLKYQYSK